MRIISFRVWGDYAIFRRHYTTSSPLTHSVPPPSALRGLVGAILGLKREEYTTILSTDKAKFGVRLLKPVKKIRLGLNLLDTKDGGWIQLDKKTFRPLVKGDGHGNPRLHTQVRAEFLKNPDYEVFFRHEDHKLMDELRLRLLHHKSVFTPYLGITECIANFEFLWDKEVERVEGLTSVLSVFRLNDLNDLKIKDDISIVREVVPVFIDEERIRQIAEEIVFNPYAGPVLADVKGAFQYPGEDSGSFVFIG